MRNFIHPWFMVLLFAVVISCKKETPVPIEPLVFSSLDATDSVINLGETTTITATATGDYLTYSWSLGFDSVYQAASTGVLFGPCSGGKTIHYANPCCAGLQIIGCTVTDGVNTAYKEVLIAVMP